MSNPEATAKLNEALDEIDEAQKRLVNATDFITDALDMIDSGGEETQPPDDDEYFGGPPGRDGERVIENKTFQETNLRDYENTALVNCKFTKALYDITLPKNLRLLSCKFQGLKAPSDDKDHVFYVNNGHPEDPLGFVMDQCLMEGCKAGNLMEFKASELYIMNMVQEDCETNQTYRQRHGRQLVLMNCKGFKEISLRGWGHYVKGCSGAPIVLYAGNLPARYSQWEEPKEQGEGNYQCAELVYLEGVGKINLGKKSVQNSPNDYPALNCIIGPNVGEVTKGIEKSTDYETIDSYLDLWDICNLQP